LSHKFAQLGGDAIARRVRVKGPHEFPLRVYRIEIGTVIDDAIFGTPPAPYV